MFPNGKVDQFAPYWKEGFEFAQINTNLRIGMFLSQVGHESQGFTRFVENLNYSADRLANTWPSRYAIKDANGQYIKIIKNKVPVYIANGLAHEIERQPQVIANKTYSKRMGNGSETSGDGWKYRGRGLKMITGKDKYIAFTNFMKANGHNVDFVQNPDLIAEPKWALWSAVWFWKINGLNKHADKSDVTNATKVINGGDIGLAERKNLYVLALKQITALA